MPRPSPLSESSLMTVLYMMMVSHYGYQMRFLSASAIGQTMCPLVTAMSGVAHTLIHVVT